MSIQYLDLPVGAESGGARISLAAEVLNWSDSISKALATHSDYILLLSDRLGTILASLGADPAAARLQAALATLPDDRWLRLLSSPRSSYMLLWPSRHDSSSVIAFLADAAEVEIRRQENGAEVGVTSDYPGSEARWSALGDGWLGADVLFMSGPSLKDFSPIDVASPHALAIDLEGVDDKAEAPRRPLASSEVQTILDRLSETRDRMGDTNQELLDFVVTFTKVLVLQRDAEAPKMFSTGSSAQYVGRSVFGNPHLDTVDLALLAEGLVHEAIHSLLYMSERLEPWVTTPDLYGPEQRTRSNWTGHALPLRSYLQAAFVWYGLAQFWCQALSAGAFPADRARARITQSVRGFLNGDVLAQIEPYRHGIVPAVLETIGGLEANILEAVDAVS